MATFTSPLVVTSVVRPDIREVMVGDLVTVALAGNKVSGGRVTRIAFGTYFVKLVGLDVPAPYELGMVLPLDRSKVIDW